VTCGIRHEIIIVRSVGEDPAARSVEFTNTMEVAMNKIALTLLSAVALLACDPTERPTPPTENAVRSAGALADWAGCGTGVSTASILACNIARDWAKSAEGPASPDGKLLFGSCQDVADGGGARKTRWMFAVWSDEGLSGEVRAPVDYEERRRFEKVSRDIDFGRSAADHSAERQAIAGGADESTFAPVDGASVRRRGAHTLVIEAQPETSTIRFCRLAPIS
jgi:hypothetical protein